MNPDPTSLESFAARLTEEKGLNGLDPEVRAQVEKDLVDRLEDRINAVLVAHLPPERVAECGQVLDTDDAAAIQKFFAEAVPNGSELIAAEMLAFRDTYVNG